MMVNTINLRHLHNSRVIRKTRENRVGVLNCIVSLTGCNLILWIEYENHEDNATKALKLIICN